MGYRKSKLSILVVLAIVILLAVCMTIAVHAAVDKVQ